MADREFLFFTWVSPDRDDIEYFEIGKQLLDNFEIDVIDQVDFLGPNKTHTYIGESGNLYFVRYVLADRSKGKWEGPYKVGLLTPQTVKIFGYSSEITGTSANKIRVQVEICPHQNIFFTDTGQFLIQKEIFTTSDDEGYFEVNLIPTDKIRPSGTTYTIKVSDETNNIIVYLENVELSSKDINAPINISQLISKKLES